MLKRVFIVGASVLTAGAWAGFLVGRSLWRTWGIAPNEAAEPLPGDDLVIEPVAVDTRGLDIAAPPEAVWPWLVQMGYGRAGWYSYDGIDMNHPSLDRIAPELQSLAVGDTMPTHPGGGFEVKVLDPGKALVLFTDRALMIRQQATSTETLAEASPNVRVTGAYLDKAMAGEFSGSWAFVLAPSESGGTRLIERFRIRMETPEMAPGPTRIARLMLGFGVFVMIRRQMLGIAARAEGRPDRVFPFAPAVPRPQPSGPSPQPA
jgi:hypothetical protein